VVVAGLHKTRTATFQHPAFAMSDMAHHAYFSYIHQDDFRFFQNAVLGFCLPLSPISTDQIRKVFLKHMDNHPEQMNEPVEGPLFVALRNAFPCKASK
jgi:hypothetical protein